MLAACDACLTRFGGRFAHVLRPERPLQMDPEEKEKMEKRDWLAEKIQMLNTQLEGFEADVEKAVSFFGQRLRIRSLTSAVSTAFFH